MIDGTREVVTLCPRCGDPIVWAAREQGDEFEPPVVSDWACDCELTNDDWSALGDEARMALAQPAAWAA